MGSPPKPWERNVASSVAPPSLPATATTTTTVPERPPAFGSTAAAVSPYTSPYSRMGSYGGYGGMGTMGGMGYGGYGGMGYGGMSYGGGYGGGYGMGGGYGGMGYGVGMPGMGMAPSLTQQLESTTQHTFGLLHSIVQTFTGVAQMLESTFMATHSSFFAMVGVVDQFGQLRDALGGVLGLFGLLRWLRGLLTGRSGDGGFGGDFKRFASGAPPPPPRQPINKKPLIVFLLAVLGIPYAMTRLIKILSEKAQREQVVQGPLDPASLAFARALYPFEATNQQELGLKENEIVAIVGKLDPATGAEVDPRLGVETEWWKGRTRDGREGWFPRKWVEVLEKKEKKVD